MAKRKTQKAAPQITQPHDFDARVEQVEASSAYVPAGSAPQAKVTLTVDRDTARRLAERLGGKVFLALVGRQLEPGDLSLTTSSTTSVARR